MLSLRERTEARLDLGGMLNRLGVRDWNCFGSDRRKLTFACHAANVHFPPKMLEKADPSATAEI